RKAAAELRERIDSGLAQALRQGSLEGEPLTEDERSRLSRARSRLTDGHIGTIHSFCRGVLVEEPALVPERPGFTELGNAESLRLRERAQSAAAWASEPGTSPLARLLESGLSRGGLRFITRGLLNRRWELEQVRRALDGGAEAFVRLVEDGLATLLDEFRREAAGTWDYIVGLFEDPAAVGYLRGKAGADWEGGTDPDALATLARVRDALAPLYAGEPRPSFEILNRLIGLGELKTGAQKCKALGGRNPFLEVRDELVGRLLPDAPSDLERERRGLELAEELLAWMEQVEGGYDGLKVESCSTDYEDLLDKVRLGLRDNPELVRFLRAGFHHFLVDEFQDTDPRQWEIIRALALPDEEEARDGSRTLFIVGDRKQAIFGFRGGDNTVFLRAEQELRSVPRSFHLPLEDNYRSRRVILDFVNPFFKRLFGADAGPGGGLLYPTAVEPQWMKARRSDAEGGTVTLVNTAGLKGEPLEALATAGVIRAILQDGVERLPGLGSLPADQDGPAVGVLARKGNQLALLAAACERLGLGGSFSVARGRGIFATEEAGWLRCVLDALVDPRDEVSLAAACLSPFLGLTYDDLMEAQMTGGGRGSGSSWSDELLNGDSPGPAGRWADLRERWGRWRRLAALGSVSRLAAAILADSGVEAAMKTAGCPDRWRRLEYILELIRGEERAGGLSGPADAATWMRENREEDDFGQPVPESAPVVLMTMHGAKGLQFPIVVLPFLKGKIAGDRTGSCLARLPDGGRMLAVKLRQKDPPYERKETFLGFLLRRSAETEKVLEEKRLFYTACTRAKDHL
ncbi:MAG TPA: hypothetical protein ENN88_00180, partial [Candidatus Coatesbacteria bacterium]|nr:hypothetical protein [Candidatus Coatesbacteria bacterium]